MSPSIVHFLTSVVVEPEPAKMSRHLGVLRNTFKKVKLDSFIFQTVRYLCRHFFPEPVKIGPAPQHCLAFFFSFQSVIGKKNSKFLLGTKNYS